MRLMTQSLEMVAACSCRFGGCIRFESEGGSRTPSEGPSAKAARGLHGSIHTARSASQRQCCHTLGIQGVTAHMVGIAAVNWDGHDQLKM
jgi:hypothetical protein